MKSRFSLVLRFEPEVFGLGGRKVPPAVTPDAHRPGRRIQAHQEPCGVRRHRNALNRPSQSEQRALYIECADEFTHLIPKI